MFGIGSLIRAATTPTGVLDPAFVNPLVSVLPRMLFAIAASYLFDLFKLFDRKVKKFRYLYLWFCNDFNCFCIILCIISDC